MKEEIKQTSWLLKFIIPVTLLALPGLSFTYLCTLYQLPNTELTWNEVVMVPLSVFISTFFVCSFFMALWYARHCLVEAFKL